VKLLPPTQHGDEGHLTAASPTAAQVTVAVAPGKLDQTGGMRCTAMPCSMCAGKQDVGVSTVLSSVFLP